MSTELRSIPQLTFKEARYVRERLLGKSERESLRLAGFPQSLCDAPCRVVTPEMRAEVARLQAELVEHTLEAGLINATEIHEYLTDAIRANAADIRNDDGSYKPISEWPEIWQRMYEGGDVEIEFKSERSHDGTEKDGPGGWDQTGTILKVKTRFPRKAELLKLAMQHKGVDALINPGDKLGSGMQAMAEAIDNAIAEGRKRASRALNP